MPPHASTIAVRALLAHLRLRFALDWYDIHGAAHWARVRAIGLHLAQRTGADPTVVELFAWLHDSCRWNDGTDPEHGQRAAELGAELNGQFYDLEPSRLELLAAACRGHSNGETEGEVTVTTCWDADRLDLGRIGVIPDPARLCNDAARSRATITWAWERSNRWADRQWT